MRSDANEELARAAVLYEPPLADKDHIVEVHSLRLLDEEVAERVDFDTADEMTVDVELVIRKPTEGMRLGVEIRTEEGGLLMQSFIGEHSDDALPSRLLSGRYSVRLKLPGGLFTGGQYRLMPAVAIHGVRWLIRDTQGVAFSMAFSVPSGRYLFPRREGYIAPILPWEVSIDSEAVTEWDVR